MRIVQFMASQKWGGAEKVFLEISNELARNHHVVALILRDTLYKDKFSKDVEIVELSANPTRHNPFLRLEILRKLRKVDADIIHTHAVKATELVYPLSRFTKSKHVGTKHNARKGKIFNKLKWVTVVSEEAKNSVNIVTNGKVRIIHNGIIPKKTKLFQKNDVFEIIAIGRLDKIKGFDILIDQLALTDLDFHLSIVGEGEEAYNLQTKIDSMRLNSSVFLKGFCEDIPNLMKECDLIVISSHSEGFPKVMIEALFYGNVLLSTPVGGVIEVIPSQFLAEHRDLGKKVSEIMNNYDSYYEQFQKLKENKANLFTLDRITQQYESFYEEILVEPI